MPGAAALSQASSAIVPSEVLKHVATVGARQAVLDYFYKPAWKAILSGIASGSTGWLEVYSALNPGSDGEAGEDLSGAISDAIPNAALRVLPLLYRESRGRYSITFLCTFTFEASTPEGGINTYLTRVELSLDSARSPEELAVRSACRRGLAKTRETFKNDPAY